MFEDKQLVWKLRLGDMDALRKIYTRYKDTMYTTAYSILNDSAAAEDVLQDVFVSFARIAPKFHLYGSLKNFLSTCAVNRCRDMLRSKMYKSVEIERSKKKSLIENNPEDQAIKTETQDSLAEALMKVPLAQREVIALHLYSDLKFRQIADIQKVSVNTVQGRYRYGLEKLRAVLDGQIEE